MSNARIIILDEIVPAKEAWGGTVRRGQRLRIIDCEGRQAIDFLCYNMNDKEERYSAPNTIKAAGTISLTKGHTLYSDLAQPIFKIVEDTYGSHDTIGAAVVRRAILCSMVSPIVPAVAKISLKRLPNSIWDAATLSPT
jgi:uncharacterized protein YcgI (DUF1989 family)